MPAGRRRRAETAFRSFTRGVAVSDSRSLQSQRDELWDWWGQHPWNWMTGKDLDGKAIIQTTDERDPRSPIKAFPEREYLRRYVDMLWTGLLESKPFDPHVLLMDKARQMMASWGTLLYMDWIGRFQSNRRMILSKSTENEAKEMLRDKVAVIQNRLPEWVQRKSKTRLGPQERYNYTSTDSYILAVAENVADRESRGGTTTVVFVDEAARQPSFLHIVGAFLPACQQLVAVTTPEFGTEGANAFMGMMEKGGAE